MIRPENVGNALLQPVPQPLAMGAGAVLVLISEDMNIHIANLCLYGGCSLVVMSELSALHEAAIVERAPGEASVVQNATA